MHALAPELREGPSERVHQQYPKRWPSPVAHDCQVEADFQYEVFRANMSDAISDAECRVMFLGFFRNYHQATVREIKGWVRRAEDAYWARPNALRSNPWFWAMWCLGMWLAVQMLLSR